MTKADLVEQIFDAGSVSETRTGVERAVDAVLGAITRGLKRSKKVQLVGFGSLEVRRRKGRVGRHPGTGARLVIAPRKTVVFRPGNGLRDEI